MPIINNNDCFACVVGRGYFLVAGRGSRETIVHEFVHQLMPNSQLCVMPTKGHCIHMTHPDAVAEQVIRWLNKAA